MSLVMLILPILFFESSVWAQTSCSLNDVQDLRAMTTLLLCQDAGVPACVDVRRPTTTSNRQTQTSTLATAAGGAINTLFHVPGSLVDMKVLPSRDELNKRDSALVEHLRRVRFVVGATGAGIAVEALARLLSSSEFCTGSDGTARSGPAQLPDRVSPEGRKCTLDRRYSSANVYLHRFLYDVDDESLKTQVEHDPLLCRRIQDLKRVFGDQLRIRAGEHKSVQIVGTPRCFSRTVLGRVTNTAVYRLRINGREQEVRASLGADRTFNRLSVINTSSGVTDRLGNSSQPPQLTEHRFTFSGQPLAPERVVSRVEYATSRIPDIEPLNLDVSTIPLPSTRDREEGSLLAKTFDQGLGLAIRSSHCCAEPEDKRASCFQQNKPESSPRTQMANDINQPSPAAR